MLFIYPGRHSMHNKRFIFQMILRVFTVSTVILKAMKSCSMCLPYFHIPLTIGTMIGYVELYPRSGPGLPSSRLLSKQFTYLIKIIALQHPFLNLIINGTRSKIKRYLSYYEARTKKRKFTDYGSNLLFLPFARMLAI